MSDIKRVAVVAFSAPPLSSGGVASAHNNLFLALNENGFHAKLFTFGDKGRIVDSSEIVRNGSPAWWISTTRFVLRWLFKLLQPGKRAYQLFDILSSMPGAMKMNYALLDFQPDVAILSDHGAPGLFTSKNGKPKIILVSHHNPARFLENPAPENYSKPDAKMAIGLENRVLKKVDAVVCPSNYMKEYFEGSYTYEGPVEVIPNLSDPQMIDGESSADIRGRLNVGKHIPIAYLPSVGSYLKGAEFTEEIVTGLSEIWDGEIAFYIPGAIEEKYQKDFNRLSSSEEFFLAGQVSYEEHIGNIKQCSFCVSPSLMENYSMALLEAAMTGLPVLALDTGGNADIIRNGENGYLAALGDTKALLTFAKDWKDSKSLTSFQKQSLAYSRKHLDSKQPIRAYSDLVNSL